MRGMLIQKEALKMVAATKAKNKYNAKTYDRLYPVVKAGCNSKIEDAAKAAGQSLNDYIVTAIYERMEREGHKVDEM